MKRHRLFVSALLLALPLFACDFALETLNLEIPDFDTSSVSGVALWQLDPQTGEYDKVQDIPLQRVSSPDGEMVSYPVHLAPSAGVTPITWAATLDRNPTSDLVRLQLFVGRPPPGSYKLSSRNSSGDSPLSTGILVIGS